MAKYIYILIILIIIPVKSFAGGYHIEVKVKNLTISYTNSNIVTVVFEILNNGLWDTNNCHQFTVIATYDEESWKNYKRPMSLQSHRDSIKILEKALKKNRIILFGEMGKGLKFSGGCKYFSKGFFFEKFQNKYAIYSVHDAI